MLLGGGRLDDSIVGCAAGDGLLFDDWVAAILCGDSWRWLFFAARFGSRDSVRLFFAAILSGWIARNFA